MKKDNAKLYLIPAPIGELTSEQVIPQETLVILPQIKHFLVENLRSARRFLKNAGYPHDFSEVFFTEINEHNQFKIEQEWISPLKQGFSLGLISEAGVPCVADPGYMLVRMVHQSGFQVVPLGGPSSIIKALMASGLSGQQFTFHGYLPVKNHELIPVLKKLEEQAGKNYTQIFIETPYRNDRMLNTILSVCRNETLLCIAAAIDTEKEYIHTRSIGEWKKNLPTLKGLPCVFLLG